MSNVSIFQSGTWVSRVAPEKAPCLETELALSNFDPINIYFTNQRLVSRFCVCFSQKNRKEEEKLKKLRISRKNPLRVVVVVMTSGEA